MNHMRRMRTTPASACRRTDAQLLAFIEQFSPTADPASILLFRQVVKANRLLTQAAEKQLEIAGLSWQKFMLLMVLRGKEIYGAGGGMQPSELSDLQGIPRNQVSMLLANLEAEGLVSRELNGTDRRKFVIRLTPLGRKTLKSKLGTQFRQITQCFGALRSQERATLLELLTRLNASLLEMHNK